jgi:ubiquinone/menaquinone biosynthesis C-methylase UbiE
MYTRGDTARQAALRDAVIQKSKQESTYVKKIHSFLSPGAKLLDIGCGTGHIINELARRHTNILFTGLDISRAMLQLTAANNIELRNVLCVQGDGLHLPFSDSSFDTVITRLAEYATKEAYRVVQRSGYFLEYGLGPDADKEIREFFADRVEKENFFFPKNRSTWKTEVCKPVLRAGFAVSSIDEYKEKDYYSDTETLMDIIEMVPLVKDFDRKKDKHTIQELADTYKEKEGFSLTWHYYIIVAQKP